ncbi:hypothetical protein G7043_06350 [Lentzea sp. NEAU-D13]|uniref:DUF3558 domain-containing protein n=1 Tax=Lentzea alba TaxID=2714351 RepID=A0A7C9VKW8_9PSEU|nr:hypothetical protein [Lentzea alba]NGY58554.1 hypothetical protein [Lentzea alba]
MRPRPIIALAITAMALAGGCTVKPVSTTTFSSAPTPTTTPAPGPVKYASATFKTCLEIQQKVPGLPSPLASEPLRGDDRFSLTCTFTTSENDDIPMITLEVELYENLRDSSGAERAKSGFNATPMGETKDSSLHLGSEARWADPGSGPGCRLNVLDENAVLMTRYNNVGKKLDPRSEECRRLASDVVKQFYAAIQP